MAIPMQRELEVAEKAVHRATILTKRVLAFLDADELVKEDHSPVTIADFGAQALLISMLHGVFPEDNFVGEEDSSVLRSNPGLCQKVWDLVSSTHVECSEDRYSPTSADEMMDYIDLGKRGEGTKSSGRVWVMDPVDGTATYIKNQQYVVALSLLQGGQELFTVLSCPNLVIEQGRMVETVTDTDGYGYRMLAVRGHGSFMRKISGPDHSDFRLPDPLPTISTSFDSSFRRLQVSSGRDVAEGSASNLIRFVNWDDPASLHIGKTQAVAKKVNGLWLHTKIWSAQLRYVAVATGCADAMVRFYPNRIRKSNIHDHAGGRLLVVEAGGVVTDLDGKELDFTCGRKLLNNHGFVASAPSIHALLLEAVQTELENDDGEK